MAFRAERGNQTAKVGRTTAIMTDGDGWHIITRYFRPAARVVIDNAQPQAFVRDWISS